MAKIDEMLEPYAERVKELDNMVDESELIAFFHFDSDDIEVLEQGLKDSWARVGMLENAAINAGKQGNIQEKIELESEVRALSKLRSETTKKIAELKKSQ